MAQNEVVENNAAVKNLNGVVDSQSMDRCSQRCRRRDRSKNLGPIRIGRCFGVVRQDEFPFNAAISGSKFGVADDANSRSA
jgi:hypothetical protein